MAYFTYTAAGARQVQAKGDIADTIKVLAQDEHPLLSAFASEGTTDINPIQLEDTLAAINNVNFFAEGANAPAAVDTARTTNNNVVQLMLVTAAVTDTQNAVAQYGMGEELKYQEMKKHRELMRNMCATMVSDQALALPTPANARTGKMAGMSAIITSHTLAQALFSQAAYDTLLSATVAEGVVPTVAYWDATRKNLIDGWTTNVTRQSSDEHRLDKTVTVYRSTLGGDVQMKYHPHLPQSIVGVAACGLILTPELWKVRNLLSLFRKSLPDLGAGPSTLFKVQWTIGCTAEKGNAQVF